MGPPPTRLSNYQLQVSQQKKNGDIMLSLLHAPVNATQAFSKNDATKTRHAGSGSLLPVAGACADAYKVNVCVLCACDIPTAKIAVGFLPKPQHLRSDGAVHHAHR